MKANKSLGTKKIDIGKHGRLLGGGYAKGMFGIWSYLLPLLVFWGSY